MTVYIDKKRQKWRYDFRMSGQRYSGYSTDPKTGEFAINKKAALRYERLLKTRVEKGHKEKG